VCTQEVNYIDSQSRIVIQYIRDTVRFALSNFGTIQDGAGGRADSAAAAALPGGTEPQRQASSSAPMPLPVDSAVVAVLLPLAEWCAADQSEFSCCALNAPLRATSARRSLGLACSVSIPAGCVSCDRLSAVALSCRTLNYCVCFLRSAHAFLLQFSAENEATAADAKVFPGLSLYFDLEMMAFLKELLLCIIRLKVKNENRFKSGYTLTDVKSLQILIQDIIRSHMSAKKGFSANTSLGCSTVEYRAAVWRVLFSKGEPIPSCPTFAAVNPVPLPVSAAPLIRSQSPGLDGKRPPSPKREESGAIEPLSMEADAPQSAASASYTATSPPPAASPLTSTPEPPNPSSVAPAHAGSVEGPSKEESLSNTSSEPFFSAAFFEVRPQSAATYLHCALPMLCGTAWHHIAPACLAWKRRRGSIFKAQACGMAMRRGVGLM
jgi:hypothetical protein